MPVTGLPPPKRRPGDLTFADKGNLIAAEASPARHSLFGPFIHDNPHPMANARVAVARLLPVFFPPDEAPLGFIRARTSRHRIDRPRTSDPVASLARRV